MYYIVRYTLVAVVIFVIFLLCTRSFWFQKNKVPIIALALIIVVLVWVFPIENVFFRFSTSVNAFQYSYGYPQTIEKVVEGKGTSYAIIFYTKHGNPSYEIMTRDQKGWLVQGGGMKTIEKSISSHKGYIVCKNHIIGTDTWIVTLTYLDVPEQSAKTQNISDNRDSTFDMVTIPSYHSNFIYYYAVINGNLEGYSLIINGEYISI